MIDLYSLFLSVCFLLLAALFCVLCVWLFLFGFVCLLNKIIRTEPLKIVLSDSFMKRDGKRLRKSRSFEPSKEELVKDFYEDFLDNEGGDDEVA